MNELTQDILSRSRGKLIAARSKAFRMARDRFKKSLKVGIIGCGAIADTHVWAYRSVGGLEFAACVDIDRQRAEAFRNQNGIAAAYSDYRELLQVDPPDVVSICTWPSSHAEIACAAAKAGVRGVLVEKPMCVDLLDADAMVESAEKFGTTMIVGHHFRFDPLVNRAKRIIESGDLGPPKFLHVHCETALLNNGTHAVDSVLHILGDPAVESVFAQVGVNGGSQERGLTAEDFSLVHLRLAGGITALLETGNLAREQFSILVTAGEGQMRLRPNRLEVLRAGAKRWDTETVPALSPHQRQAEVFVKAVEDSNVEHIFSIANARRTQEILIGILASASVRQPLSVPLENRNWRYEELIARLHMR